MSAKNIFYEETREPRSNYFFVPTKIHFDRKSRGRNQIHKCVRPPPPPLHPKSFEEFCRGRSADVVQTPNVERPAEVDPSVSSKSEFVVIKRKTGASSQRRRCASYSGQNVRFLVEHSGAKVSKSASSALVEPNSTSAANVTSSPLPEPPPFVVSSSQLFPGNERAMVDGCVYEGHERKAGESQQNSAAASRTVCDRQPAPDSKNGMKLVVDEASQTDLPLAISTMCGSCLSDSDIECEENGGRRAPPLSRSENGVFLSKKLDGRRRIILVGKRRERLPVGQRKDLQESKSSVNAVRTEPPAGSTKKMRPPINEAMKNLIIGRAKSKGERGQAKFDKSSLLVGRSSAYDVISNFSRVLKTLKDYQNRRRSKIRRRMLTRTGVHECPESRTLLTSILSSGDDTSVSVSASADCSSQPPSSSSVDESGGESWVLDSESEPEVESERRADATWKDSRRHIHPCVCDLTKAQRAKIEKYLNEKMRSQMRFEQRVKEVEEELRRLEEEEEERRKREELERELYEDEYEMEGDRMKRKKRSARRVSMVSLGVKQIINWRKEPKIAVKYTKTFELRRANPTYCKPKVSFDLVPKRIQYVTNVPVRHTRASELRTKFNKNLKKLNSKREYRKYPNRPEFVLRIR